MIPVLNAPSDEMVKYKATYSSVWTNCRTIQPNVGVSDPSNINRLVEVVNRVDVADSLEVSIVDLKEAWVEDIVLCLSNCTRANRQKRQRTQPSKHRR